MKTEQLQRANQIVKRVTVLANKRDKLKFIIEKGIDRFDIEPCVGSNKFHLDRMGGDDGLDLQPNGVTVVIEATINTLISLYQTEIDKLENEFNTL